MAESPLTGYVAVLRYYDRSGNIAAFGPYPTEDAALEGIATLKQMPLRDGDFDVLPLFGGFGAVSR